MTIEHLLEAKGLGIGYERHDVASGLDLTLDSGEFICLLGPNGAGKSTLLRTLAGLQAALAGSVRVAGVAWDELSPRQKARRLSVVLTEHVDPGRLTAEALVSLGRHPHTDWLGNLDAEDHRIVRAAIDNVGASDLAQRPVSELSDGERQKVFIARALAQEPRLMLLDEPTAFLDLPRRVEIMRLLRDLAHREGRAILMSSHDLDLALRGADRLWLLTEHGELHTGAPEDLVLQGTFARVFASAGVAFDLAEGGFRLAREPQHRVQLKGDDLVALWTRRALERAGLEVGDDPADISVSATGEPESAAWQLTVNGNESRHQTIASLVTTIAGALSKDR